MKLRKKKINFDSTSKREKGRKGGNKKKNFLNEILKMFFSNFFTIVILYLIVRFISAISIQIMSATTANLVAKNLQNTNQGLIEIQSINYLTLGLSILVVTKYSDIKRRVNALGRNFYNKLKFVYGKQNKKDK